MLRLVCRACTCDSVPDPPRRRPSDVRQSRRRVCGGRKTCAPGARWLTAPRSSPEAPSCQLASTDERWGSRDRDRCVRRSSLWLPSSTVEFRLGRLRVLLANRSSPRVRLMSEPNLAEMELRTDRLGVRVGMVGGTRLTCAHDRPSSTTDAPNGVGHVAAEPHWHGWRGTRRPPDDGAGHMTAPLPIGRSSPIHNIRSCRHTDSTDLPGHHI